MNPTVFGVKTYRELATRMLLFCHKCPVNQVERRRLQEWPGAVNRPKGIGSRGYSQERMRYEYKFDNSI